MKSTIFSLAVCTMLLTACENKQAEPAENVKTPVTETSLGSFTVQTPIRTVPDGGAFVSTEDSLEMTQVADMLLEQVLSGKLQANEPPEGENAEGKALSADAVKALLEKEGGKETIAALKLNEEWLYNPDSKTLSKKVTSVSFAKRFLTAEGVYMGNKALFYISF